jgi:HEAT repeat protein
LQKQNRKEEAAAPLVQLINRFPSSSWRREAEALLVVLGREADVKAGLERDNCEIKILALQSLFQADEERAIQIVTDSLKANPTQCEGFQAAAISMLGRRGSGARAVPILLAIAHNNTDLKLRLTAIRLLGDQHSDQVTDELIKIYDTDQNRDVRAQILRALSESRTTRGNAKVIEIARGDADEGIRELAIRSVAGIKDPAALDELMRIYDSAQTLRIRSFVVRALMERREDPRARAKVWEIARKDPAPELRSYAIRNLHGDDEEQTIAQFVALYDSEQNQMVKSVLIRGFGESKHKVALQKLMTIARNDPSVELRKVAIRYLGQSKDPEALRLLEELLK